MNLADILKEDGKLCECGKNHYALVKKTVIEEGAINKAPALVKAEGAGSVFMICDRNTYDVAGEKAEKLFTEAGITVKKYVLKTREVIEPDEHAVGSVMMNYQDCDMIVSVGSGVINDVGKIVAAACKKTYMIIGTAPSMDGYASGTSSMVRGGHKVTITSKCPDIVVGDLDILCNAPMDMLRSGVGDMLAKYISICEWRIGRIVCGEYYCEKVAEMVRQALREVVSLAPGLMKRDKEAVKAVMNGMVLSGIAANYATISRPVSGDEHYFSHVWDMRGLAFGTPIYFHGIQCGAATIDVLRVYEILKNVTPDKQKGIDYCKNFDMQAYYAKLREFMGAGAEAMIAENEKDHKYLPETHSVRIERIVEHWDEILQIMKEELDLADAISTLKITEAPDCSAALGKTNEELAKTFVFSKDIRDKYVAARLCWDLGIIDEVTEKMYGCKV